MVEKLCCIRSQDATEDSKDCWKDRLSPSCSRYLHHTLHPKSHKHSGYIIHLLYTVFFLQFLCCLHNSLHLFAVFLLLEYSITLYSICCCCSCWQHWTSSSPVNYCTACVLLFLFSPVLPLCSLNVLFSLCCSWRKIASFHCTVTISYLTWFETAAKVEELQHTLETAANTRMFYVWDPSFINNLETLLNSINYCPIAIFIQCPCVHFWTCDDATSLQVTRRAKNLNLLFI